MASTHPSTTRPDLSSFGEEISAVVIGASGGLGGALVDALAAIPDVARIWAFSRSPVAFDHAHVTHAPIDIADESSIRRAAALTGTAHIIIVATGILHDGEALQPEKTWHALEPVSLERAFRINAVGPALVAKHFLPLLPRDRKTAFAAISARVGSIADNALGGWYAYRSSKAALNMLIKSFAIELARRNPAALCVGLHPGTVDTALSKPFQGFVPEGRLFTPARSAGHLLSVLERLTPEDSGHLFAWDGRRIPF